MVRGNFSRHFSWIFIVLLLASFAFSITLSHSMQETYGKRQREEKMLYIPSGRYLKPASLGFQQVTADMLWLQAVSYFGAHAVTDRKYPWLPNLLEAITTLDPLWQFPYHFAGVLLSVEGNMVDQANKIVRKGMDLHPDIWQFPFYIGFNYFHIKRNPRCGAKYMYKAGSYPGSPKYLIPLAARLSAQGNTLENHIDLCNRLLSMTRDESIHKQIKKNCEDQLSYMGPPENVSEEECI